MLHSSTLLQIYLGGCPKQQLLPNNAASAHPHACCCRRCPAFLFRQSRDPRLKKIVADAVAAVEDVADLGVAARYQALARIVARAMGGETCLGVQSVQGREACCNHRVDRWWPIVAQRPWQSEVCMPP